MKLQMSTAETRFLSWVESREKNVFNVAWKSSHGQRAWRDQERGTKG